MQKIKPAHSVGEVLLITSYPPRVCGIATYSKDLIDSLQDKFETSFSMRICALEENSNKRDYPIEVKYSIQSSRLESYVELASIINNDDEIKIVFVQHEFGLFGGKYGEYLLQLLYYLDKPVFITFHSVIPKPSRQRRRVVQALAKISERIVVMTRKSSSILQEDYDINKAKILLIPHGTHVVLWKNKRQFKKVYQLDNRLILSNFGLLGANKSIETALDALPAIVERFPNVLYLVLGRTHPGVLENEGEKYREFLEDKVVRLGLQQHVRFVNEYLTLTRLLEYLYLTDIYLFTSKDPNQAVSGTFAYAMSSACPIISTPIPHALEMMKDNVGKIIDFENPEELAEATIMLLEDNHLREQMGRNAFAQTRATSWENSAIAHARLLEDYLFPVPSDSNTRSSLIFKPPPINLNHILSLTNEIGMIQFSQLCEPDINSGYTLDDNARGLIAMSLQLDMTQYPICLELISTYLNFIEYCQQPNGAFLNYVDNDRNFIAKNTQTNLEDSNGRAIWALGVLISHQHRIPSSFLRKAVSIFERSIIQMPQLESPRAIAFTIKGLFFIHKVTKDEEIVKLIETLADKLLEKYNTVSDTNWRWFEEYLTYANSTLPEAMLYAYLVTDKPSYKMIAHVTFEFLMSKLFIDKTITVISNQGWYQKGETPNRYGEQPIDVAYMIQALDLFYRVFKDKNYLHKLEIAFSWFLGNNHLNQIMYNPLTGGGYDGLEEHNVNLNQGAESSVCFLTSQLIVERIHKELASVQPKLIRMINNPVS